MRRKVNRGQDSQGRFRQCFYFFLIFPFSMYSNISTIQAALIQSTICLTNTSTYSHPFHLRVQMEPQSFQNSFKWKKFLFTLCALIYTYSCTGTFRAIPRSWNLGELEPIGEVEALIRGARLSLTWQMQKYHDNGHKSWDFKAWSGSGMAFPRQHASVLRLPPGGYMEKAQ